MVKEKKTPLLEDQTDYRRLKKVKKNVIEKNSANMLRFLI